MQSARPDLPGYLSFFQSARGFSLAELLVSMTLGLIVLAGSVALFRQGVDISFTVTQRAEMQQNARVGTNWLARDLSIAGTSIPGGGIGLPSGSGSSPTKRGCTGAGICGILGNFVGNRLYAVTPGNGLGPQVNGVATDAVTLVYLDDSLTLSQPLASINSSGSQIRVDPADIPLISDPAVGLNLGDILLLTNAPNGAAIGVVTSLPSGDKVDFANSDPLNLNQPSAKFGNIASLAGDTNPKVYPPTTAARINAVSYFIELGPGGDGVVGTADDEPRLMRQVNATPAVPVALNIENLQLTYDIFDTDASAATSAQPSPLAPNQIRKVNIVVGARAPVEGLFRRGFERVTLTTSVSVRNLGWFDRYEDSD